MQTLNISCYKFVPLPDAAALRGLLHARAGAAGVLGSILLAAEGINLFLAGPAGALRGFVGELRCDARFADLQPKESWSDGAPFRRLRVRLKREIIRMDQPAIRPFEGRAPALDPVRLRRWLDRGRCDAGRELLLLDTRNAFEVDQGSFDNALDWGLRRFGEFPAALQAHQGALQGKTVVSFCTGGIRCEKAALLMRARGLDSVYQLEGGILKYLELTDGAHYHGGCFVFDERVLLGLDLSVSAGAAMEKTAGAIKK